MDCVRVITDHVNIVDCARVITDHVNRARKCTGHANWVDCVCVITDHVNRADCVRVVIGHVNIPFYQNCVRHDISAI